MFDIRDYRTPDEPAWLQCRLLSFFGTDYYDDVKIAKTVLAPDHIELVVERDGTIVGLIDVEIEADAATIDSIAVHPSAQRLGLGSALLEAAMQRLPTRVRTLDAWTREHPGTNAWYQAVGFRENYRYLHVYRGDDDPAFPGPEGMSSPIIAMMHAPIEREPELRAAYRRVCVCRQYLMEVK